MNAEDMTRTILGIENDTHQCRGEKAKTMSWKTIPITKGDTHLANTGIENDTQHFGVWQIWM